MKRSGSFSHFVMCGLCALLAGGCVASKQRPDVVLYVPPPANTSMPRPVITLLPIEESMTDAKYKADPTFVGNDWGHVTIFVFIPVDNETNDVRLSESRTDVVQNAVVQALQQHGLATVYQTTGLEPAGSRDDGHLMLWVRVTKFEADGDLFILPLIISNAFARTGGPDRKISIALESRLLRPGIQEPVWQGTVEGSSRKSVSVAINDAVEKLILESKIEQVSTRARNDTFTRQFKAGEERKGAGAWEVAVEHYAKAYAIAVTDEQSMAALRGLAEVVRGRPTVAKLPEEARRYAVQAESLVKNNQVSEAIDLYSQALEIAPWWADFHFNKAILLRSASRYSEAATSMKQYLVLMPNAPNARALQDRIYEWEAGRK